MDIRSLEAFTAVAEELSFSSGADRLYISQSAASKYIRHLETELGVCLFDRTRRQIRLTPAGERMLPQAKALLSQYRSLLESIREETALHIAMLPVADSYGFAQLLADFSAGMPGSSSRNSSPPKRIRVSVWRMQLRMTRATVSSTRSPAWWP